LNLAFLAIRPASDKASIDKQAQVFGVVAETSEKVLSHEVFLSKPAIPLATAAISCLNTF